MNERIEKLANSAGLFVDLRGKPWPQAMSAEKSVEAYEKFALSIVQECISICERVGSYDHTSPEDCASVMKKQFGIK